MRSGQSTRWKHLTGGDCCAEFSALADIITLNTHLQGILSLSNGTDSNANRHDIRRFMDHLQDDIDTDYETLFMPFLVEMSHLHICLYDSDNSITNSLPWPIVIDFVKTR